jgi:hypothetical protein
MQYDRSKLDWVDHPEQIWVIAEESVWLEGSIEEAHSSKQGAEAAIALNPKFHKRLGIFEAREFTLHRPSLRAVYGGPTLIEALWNEMDAIMERLMTGNEKEDVCGRESCDSYDEETGVCSHVDNGDRYRAEELAWVLAIVTNAYDPSVDRIRAETMRRWKAAEAEADAQEEALNPDEQEEL